MSQMEPANVDSGACNGPALPRPAHRRNELAMHITDETSAQQRLQCWVSLGPWYSGGGMLQLLQAVHWALKALTSCSTGMMYQGPE